MLITIITINYNNILGIKKTMDSVLAQTYTNIEYIVIDGGSTDGSVDEIKNHTDELSYWVSEPDLGVYDAMNKGIKKANGDYIFFLNSGDYLIDDTIIDTFIGYQPTEDILYGDLKIEEKNQSRIKTYPKELSFSYFLKDSLPHSGGGFFKRSCFVDDLSFYDNELKIMSDWKWSVIGLFKKGYSYRGIDITIGVFEFGTGISSLPENRALLSNERQQILYTEFKYLYPEFKDLLKYKKAQNRLMKSKLFKVALKLNNLFKTN